MQPIDLNEHQIEQVRTMSGLGLSIEKIATSLRIGSATLARLKNRDPRVSQAVSEGRIAAQATVAKSLFQAARDGSVSTAIWLEKTRFGINDELNLPVALNFLASLNVFPADFCQDLLDIHDEMEREYEIKVANLFTKHVEYNRKKALGIAE